MLHQCEQYVVLTLKTTHLNCTPHLVFAKPCLPGSSQVMGARQQQGTTMVSAIIGGSMLCSSSAVVALHGCLAWKALCTWLPHKQFTWMAACQVCPAIWTRKQQPSPQPLQVLHTCFTLRPIFTLRSFSFWRVHSLQELKQPLYTVPPITVWLTEFEI